MTLTIEIDDIAPGLNGSQGLIRMHHHNRTKLKNKWVLLIRSKTLDKFKGKVTIDYYRSSVMPPDADNLSASFKFIGDALVANEVIEDDSMAIVTRFTAHWLKAKNNSDKRTVIVISNENNT